LAAATARREARARLDTRARAGVVDALGRAEGRAAVGAAREEDVVVAQAVVLPGDEELVTVDGEARVPLVGGRGGVGRDTGLRVVELCVGREGGAAVVAAGMEDV